MAWAKIDDRFYDHPKTVTVGTLGAGLFALALSYASNKLTDGFIPTVMIRRLVVDVDDPIGLADMLVEAGLFERVDGGYLIHDYLDYNPSRDEALALREARAEAGRLGGLRSGQSKREANAIANVEANRQPELNPVPAPIPSIGTNQSKRADTPDAKSVNMQANEANVEANAVANGQAKTYPVPVPVPIDSNMVHDRDDSARQKCETAAPPPGYSPDQRRFLAMFGAKRFANSTQAGTMVTLLAAYPADQFWKAAKWAADNGFAVGKAVTSMGTALKRWDKPKPAGKRSGATRYPDEAGYHVMSQSDWDNAEVGEPSL